MTPHRYYARLRRVQQAFQKRQHAAATWHRKPQMMAEDVWATYGPAFEELGEALCSDAPTCRRRNVPHTGR